MRWLSPVLIPLLVGCPLPDRQEEDEGSEVDSRLSRTGFLRRFGPMVCEALEECASDVPCTVDHRLDVADACLFNEGLALDCINGEFGCQERYGMWSVDIPLVCLRVFECPYGYFDTGESWYTTPTSSPAANNTD